MKKHQIVTIYEDPFTQQHIEGQAKLIKKIRQDEYFETWNVRFVDDTEHPLKGDPVVSRKILREELP